MKKLIALFLAGLLSLVPAQTASAATEDVSVGVFLINWLDDTHQDMTVESAYNGMFVGSSSVAAFYNDVTYGQVSLSGDVLGWYTVNFNKAEPYCNTFNWRNDANNQAISRGFDPSSYDIRIYAWDGGGCGYSGKAEGSNIYINVMGSQIYTSIYTHELGHTFGLDHANLLRCTDKLGNQVSIYLNKGDSCVTQTYGDRYDTMGNSSSYGFSAIFRTKAGWLPISDTQKITAAGTYSLVPLEWNSGIRQLEIVPPKQGKYQPWSLCLEVRQSYGWDQFNETGQYGNPWATNGIHIRQHQSCLTPDSQGVSGFGTRLIDATPLGDTQNLDTPLPIGQTFKAEGVNIKLLTIGPNGASVEITYLKGNR